MACFLHPGHRYKAPTKGFCALTAGEKGITMSYLTFDMPTVKKLMAAIKECHKYPIMEAPCETCILNGRFNLSFEIEGGEPIDGGSSSIRNLTMEVNLCEMLADILDSLEERIKNEP